MIARSRISSLFALLLALAGGVLCAAEPDGASVRRYQSGLLARADFAASAPEKLPERDGIVLHALVHTEVRFAHKWKIARRGRRVRATLTEVDFYAVVHPGLSWNTRPRDAVLLAHTQGHFDLAAIYAEKMQRQVTERIASAGVHGSGRNQSAAEAELTKSIESQCADLLAKLYEEHVTFDTTTGGGSNPKFEAKQRRRQRTMMQELGIQPPEK